METDFYAIFLLPLRGTGLSWLGVEGPVVVTFWWTCGKPIRHSLFTPTRFRIRNRFQTGLILCTASLDYSWQHFLQHRPLLDALSSFRSERLMVQPHWLKVVRPTWEYNDVHRWTAIHDCAWWDVCPRFIRGPWVGSKLGPHSPASKLIDLRTPLIVTPFDL